MAKIKFKRSSVTGRKPTGLESGEIGINSTDRKIYVGNDSGAIVQLGNDPIIEDRLEAKKGATISGGTVTISGNQSNTGTLTVSGDITSTSGKVKSATLDTGAIKASSVSTTGATTSQTLTVTGNTVLAGTKTGALESTTLNAMGVATVASLQSQGSISAGGNAVVTGKVTSGSLDTGAIVSTGDVKGATVTTTGKMKSGSVETGAITGSSLVATGNVKGATVTSTGKLTAGSLETGAITGSTVTTTGDITTATKVKAASIELANYDNFDAKYIKVGTAITNAVKLQTPRKIAGVNFDGSADISIPAANVGALPAAGGAMTGALTSNSDITTNKVVEGMQVRSTYRMGIYRNTTPYFDFIRPDIITADALPTANQTTGMLRFNEGSKTTDVHGGLVRGQLNHSIQTDGNSQLIMDNRDSAGTVKNRIRMYSSDGSTRVDVGSFVAGTTTLGTTTTGALTASSATINGSATVTGSLSMNAANAGLELGSLTTAGTPFIDFKTSGKNVDYDMRILANSAELLITTPGVSHGLRMPYVDKITLHQTAASAIVTKYEAAIIRDYGNGNVTLSAGRTSTDDTVGGDLYLGFTNASNKSFTKSVRLEAPMTWKNTTQIVNSAGKLVGASLDTAYLPLTGGTLSNNIAIKKAGIGSFSLKNSTIDTSVALPTSTQYIGLIQFSEDRAGVEKIRSRLESQILTNGHTYTSLYVRDGADVTKANIRLESETALVNITTGGFRVAGTSTLVGAVTASGNLTVNGTTTTKSIVTTGTLSVSGALTADNLRTTGEVSGGTVTARNADINTLGDGNSHIWFKTNSGTEKAVIFAGADKVFSIRSNGRSFYFGEGGTGMIRIGEGAYGEEKALIRGVVDGGGHVDWRKRSSGVQIDCPNSDTSAYNVWKATKWGRAHIAAMDVHMQGDIESNALVRLLVGNQAFLFNGGGNMSCASITSSGAVYANGGSTFLENNGNVWGSVWEGGHLYNHIEARIRAHMGTRLIANIDDAPAIQTFKAPAPVVDDETNFRYLSNLIDALKDKIEFGTATDEDEQRLLELRKQRSGLI